MPHDRLSDVMYNGMRDQKGLQSDRDRIGLSMMSGPSLRGRDGRKEQERNEIRDSSSSPCLVETRRLHVS